MSTERERIQKHILDVGEAIKKEAVQEIEKQILERQNEILNWFDKKILKYKDIYFNDILEKLKE